MCLKSILSSILHMRRTKSPIVAPAEAQILDNNNMKQEDAALVEELEKLLLNKLSSPSPNSSAASVAGPGTALMQNGVNKKSPELPERRKSPISTISDKLGISVRPPSSPHVHPHAQASTLITVSPSPKPSPSPSPKPALHQVLLTSGDAGQGHDFDVELPAHEPMELEELQEDVMESPALSKRPFSVSPPHEDSQRSAQSVRVAIESKKDSAPGALRVRDPEERIPSIAEQCRSFESKVNKYERNTNISLSKPGKGNSVVPKKIYKGSFRESNNGNANGASAPAADKAVVFGADLKPLDSPKTALAQALAHLNTTNWELNVDGFKLLVRLARFHPDFLHSELHQINLIGLKHLSNLRSQVTRSACLFFKEMFEKMGKLMEQDVEKISEKLLDKSADTNKFIREDAAAALEAMVKNVSPAKALASLDPYGTKHKNAVVRSTTSRMTSIAVEKVGADRCLNELGDRILPMLVSFVQEGSLETRMKGKAALSVLAAHPDFDYQLKTHITPEALRHVTKCVSSIKSEVQGRSY